MADAKPAPAEPTEAQLEYKRQQDRLIPVMAGECRAIVFRYAMIYGMDYETACWALYSAMLTTLDQAHPTNQPTVMRAVLYAMDKRLRGLMGEKPPEPAAPAPAPAAEAEEDAEDSDEA